jgi:uncharacterized membrane protein SpoIIM required for sporulation
VRSQDEFVAARRHGWNELEVLLASGKELHRLPPEDISRVARLYRNVCADLMQSRGRHGPELVAYLDGLSGRAHNVLHGARPWSLASLVDLVVREFPRTLRRRVRFFSIASALFCVPFVVGLVGSIGSIDFAESVLSPGQLAGMAEMYEGELAGRPAGENATMAGFYVWNNVGIAFRCFATGILFGLGSVFFLLHNGLTIGTVMGFVTYSGSGRNIFTFICGHAPFELTAIVISGAAGLQMGWALIETQGRTRIGSLRAQAPEVLTLVLGAGLMLVVAALVEGFWSPSAAPAPVKWTVAAVFTLAVAAYLALAGREAQRRSA